MYRKKTIAAAYEGASWAFPVETYRDTPHARICYRPTLIFPDFSLFFLTF
jgi:hypothetical protein